jgi:hypothetical protein
MPYTVPQNFPQSPEFQPFPQRLLGVLVPLWSESEGRELGAFALSAGTINLGTPETGPNAATPTPETNEKVESESGTEPESDPNAETSHFEKTSGDRTIAWLMRLRQNIWTSLSPFSCPGG